MLLLQSDKLFMQSDIKYVLYNLRRKRYEQSQRAKIKQTIGIGAEKVYQRRT